MAFMKAVREKAWRFYNQWRKEKTYSPALKKNIRVSLQGWYHITGERGLKKRGLKDAYRRMKLLPYAKRIVKRSTTIQDFQERGGVTYYALEAVVSVREKGINQPRRVKVVLKQDKKGNLIFYSVMDRKRKRRNVSPVSLRRKGRRA